MSIVIAVATGIVAISTASIFIKLCDAHPLVIASYRLGLASLILAPFALRHRRYGKILRGRWKLLLLTGLFLALHLTFWIASLRYSSVASSVVIVNINPVFVGLGSYIFLKEKATKLTILGIFLSITGGTVIGLSDFTFSTHAGLGDLLALDGALMASGYLMAGRKLRQEMDLLSYIFPVYATASIVVLLIALAVGVPFFRIFIPEVRLVSHVGHYPPADRPLNLQLGPQILFSFYHCRPHPGRTHRLDSPRLLDFG